MFWESFSVGSVSRRFQQEIVSRNLLQRADINFAKPQEKSYFRNRKFGFVPFVSTLRNLERVRVATGHFTIYSFLEGKVKILAKVGRQRFVAYGWRPLGGCRAPPKKSFFKKIGVNFFSLTSSDVGWGSDKSVTCFTLSVPLILSVSQSGEIHWR